MGSNSRITALLVGDYGLPEFAELAAMLAAQTALTSLACPRAALAWIHEAATPPELVVIAQSLPGQFSPEQFEPLRRLAPLACMARVLGSWCEGEGRSGKPWLAALRMYWHQAPARLAVEIERLTRGDCPHWGLTGGASDEDRLLLARADEPPRDKLGLIVVHARRAAAAEALVDASQSRGYAAVWAADLNRAYASRPVACLFDATCLTPTEIAELESLRTKFPEAPIVALLDFPRSEDCRRAREHGAAAVVSKPLLLDDLFWQIEQLTRRSINARN